MLVSLPLHMIDESSLIDLPQATSSNSSRDRDLSPNVSDLGSLALLRKVLLTRQIKTLLVSMLLSDYQLMHSNITSGQPPVASQGVP